MHKARRRRSTTPSCIGQALLSALACALLVFASIAYSEEARETSEASGGLAESLYDRHQQSVVQIRIVDNEAGGRQSTGSGFFVADGSLLATNYHVISSAVMDADDHRIEAEFADETHVLTVLAVDVVNDLALLQSPAAGKPLAIAQSIPNVGSSLYSLGNPYNIGKSLVEGSYNGLVKGRFFDQIHFSGAINSGMSGGPAINPQAEVVGVNVATAGNQVGFLVPVKHLRALLEKHEAQEGATEDFFVDMAAQVDAATSSMIDQVIVNDWPTDTLGSAQVLDQIHEYVECWGDSNENKESGVNTITKGCSNKENIYLSQSFTTGYFGYQFGYYTAPEYSPTSFYYYVNNRTAFVRSGNKVSKEDVGGFTCMDKVVENADNNIQRKINYCVRAYKKLVGLFDVSYSAVSVDQNNKALWEQFNIVGVSKTTAENFLQKFISQVGWQ